MIFSKSGLNLSQIDKNWQFRSRIARIVPQIRNKAFMRIPDIAQEPLTVDFFKNRGGHHGQALRFVNCLIPEILSIMNGYDNRLGMFIEGAKQVMAIARSDTWAMVAFKKNRVTPVVSSYLKKSAKVFGRSRKTLSFHRDLQNKGRHLSTQMPAWLIKFYGG